MNNQVVNNPFVVLYSTSLPKKTSKRNTIFHRHKIVLQAIAKEGLAQDITAAKFIKKYNLNSASSVQSAVKLLLKNDLLTQTDNGYRIYDFFLSEWLSTVY